MDDANDITPDEIEISDIGYRFSREAKDYLEDFYRFAQPDLCVRVIYPMVMESYMEELIQNTGATQEHITQWIENKLANDPTFKPYKEEPFHSLFVDDDLGEMITAIEVAPNPLLTPINPKDKTHPLNLERENRYFNPDYWRFNITEGEMRDGDPRPGQFLPESENVCLPVGATNNYKEWTRAQVINWTEIVLRGLNDRNVGIVRNQDIDGITLEDDIRDEWKWRDRGMSQAAWRRLQVYFNAVANEFNGHR